MPVPEHPNFGKHPFPSGEQMSLEELAVFQQDAVDRRVVQEMLTQHECWSSQKLKAAMEYLNKGVAPVFSMARHYSFVHKDQELNSAGWYEVYDCALNFCAHDERVFLGGSVRLDGLQSHAGMTDHVLSHEELDVLDARVLFPYAPTLYIPQQTSVLLPRGFFKKRVLLFSVVYNNFFNAPTIDWKCRERIPFFQRKLVRCASETQRFACHVVFHPGKGTWLVNNGPDMACVHLSRRK